jgi:actin-related protein
MPLKDPEARKEYRKQYYEKNKERFAEQQKEYKKWYNEENREHRLEYNKKWYQKNKEYKKEKEKQYSKTEAGKKASRINAWKQNGVKCDDYNVLYERYINTTHCENCNVELIEGGVGSNKRCLDHCHESGKFRNVLCNKCNIRRG